jgi:hypothetical protein
MNNVISRSSFTWTYLTQGGGQLTEDTSLNEPWRSLGLDLFFPGKNHLSMTFACGKSSLGSIAPRGIPQYRLGYRINPGHKIGPEHKTYVEDHEVSPTTFGEVLLRWERTWMWDNIQWEGDDNWMADSIREGTCIAVTDGSYMKELYTDFLLVAFVIECSRGRGRIWGSFPEVSRCACSYRGELVGLMAIHLILLSINKVNKDLSGFVIIHSDCLGALDKVKNLPPSRIPATGAHSDVLKNILVNCSHISFDRYYSHALAHQDDQKDYRCLSQPSQLNCSMDYLAKKVIWDLQATQPPP